MHYLLLFGVLLLTACGGGGGGGGGGLNVRQGNPVVPNTDVDFVAPVRAGTYNLFVSFRVGQV